MIDGSPKNHKHNCVVTLKSGARIQVELTSDLIAQIQEKYPKLTTGSPHAEHFK